MNFSIIFFLNSSLSSLRDFDLSTAAILAVRCLMLAHTHTHTHTHTYIVYIVYIYMYRGTYIFECFCYEILRQRWIAPHSTFTVPPSYSGIIIGRRLSGQKLHLPLTTTPAPPATCSSCQVARECQWEMSKIEELRHFRNGCVFTTVSFPICRLQGDNSELAANRTTRQK